MSKLKMRDGDWAIVLDGSKALFLQNRGDKVHPDLVAREVRQHADPPNRELHTDRPGKVQQSATSSHSAIELTDRHDEAKRVFIAEVADELDRLATSDKFCSFVVIAPPPALG